MKRLSFFLYSLSIPILLFFLTPNALAVWEGDWCIKDPYPDYAPRGVPDFEQKFDAWGKVPGVQDPLDPTNNPDNPGWRWTWDGPVAWANSIWWMDSRFESHFNPSPVPPPAIWDSFPLIYSPDPGYDDHDPQNVPTVVGELAWLLSTDGNPYCSWNGTQVWDMIYGLEMGLDAAGFGKWNHDPFGPYFVVGWREYPAFYEIAREVVRCEDVVLLLGIYEEDPAGTMGEYLRRGGHYVTVAAANEAEMQLHVCDPFLDMADPGAGDHSDAANVSHDLYQARDILPLGCVLADYPWDLVATNFKGINPSGLPDVFLAEGGLGRIALVEYMIHLSPEWDKDVYEKPPYTDYCGMESPYAPGTWWGVPDFDQRQDLWGKVPGLMPDDPANNPGNFYWRWTWCGPVAVADSLWWLDSKFEEIVVAEQGLEPVPPPVVSDHFPLVESYGQGRWDDHAPENVEQFVADLASRMQVDGGIENWSRWIGTLPQDLHAAVVAYLRERGLYQEPGVDPDPKKILFEAELLQDPTFEDVTREVYRCQDVVLLLGFYEYTDNHEYVRIGGHYVACTGVDRQGSRAFLSDPYLDMWMPMQQPTGKEQPLQFVDPLLHNDAKVISHDEYHVGTLSDGEFWLTDYPWSRGPEEGANELFFFIYENFMEANPTDLPPLDILHSCEYITKVEYMLHVSPTTWFWKGWPEVYHDYAQAGVPDFSQKQYVWGKVPGLPFDDPQNNPQNPQWKWTWCGPVAVANSLWWMDSKFETELYPPTGAPVKPPTVSDHFPLVQSHLAAIDDHDAQNVQPLVADLAKYMSTDGGDDHYCEWEGTHIGDMAAGIVKYIHMRGLQPGNPNYDFGLEVGVTQDPDLVFHIAKELRRCQDVILLLGFYRWEGDYYTRVGGHFVTAAGVNETERLIGISDPWWDTVRGDNGPSSIPGRFGFPHTAVQHDPKQHNDADFVAHDIYQVGVLSDGENFLQDYLWSDSGDPQVREKIELNFGGTNEPMIDLPLPPEYVGDFLTKMEFMVHVSPVEGYWKLPHHDYAQAGVPDFDQKQDNWGKNPVASSPEDPVNNPGQPGWQWTWCGPAAVANSLWWMDSQFETLLTAPGTAPLKPPAISDSFPLVRAYVPDTDDHDAQNVMPLVEDLAGYMMTDGEPWCQWIGTRVEDMVEGIRKYLADRGLEPENPSYEFGFEVGRTKDPDLIRHIAPELRRCQDVILLLGFYRLEQGFYQRVGGHFVTAAGLSEKNNWIGICDPWMDTVLGDNGPSGPGRFGFPHDPVVHPSYQHDDADFVSHDIYQVGVLSDGENYLVDYPWSDTGDPVVREAMEQNFWKANRPMDSGPPPDIQPVGLFLTKIEYMVHVSPVGGPVAVAQVNPEHASVNQIVTFDGTASYHTNPARSIVKYEWDFDGDGSYDAEGPVVTHAYPNCIIYHGSLRVTDDDTPPMPAESFFDVFVDVDNHPPVADADGPYTIDEGEDLILDASGSSDPDAGCGDSIQSYRWDLNGDGAYDDASGANPTIPWADLSGLLRHPDLNPIGLEVTDLFGETGTDSTTLTIYVNEPVAVATASPNPVEVSVPVTFDGSGSYHKHPLHSIVAYEWDFDDDGLWDAMGPVVNHAFGATGDYDVTLQVTDDNSPAKTDTDVVTVRVLPRVPLEEIAVGLGNAGHGRFEMVEAKNYVLTHNLWKSVPWVSFTARGIETRPALGDLDGDGANEIVVGLGPGGHGRLALFEDRSTGYAFTGWLVIPWPAYNAMNGETWTACGDVDGDGLDEIVVGLGPGGGGWFLVFDDAGAGYALMAARKIPPIMPAIVTAVFPSYNASVGETRPAVGDLDGDAGDEIVIGLGPYPMEGGWFFLYSGAPGFTLTDSRRVPYPAYNSANGETWPVTGDLDADGREEIAVGLGTSPVSHGWMAFFDDTVAGGFLGWKKLPGWSPYHANKGEMHPGTANLDGDASAELVVGLGHGGVGRMWIADDWGTGVAHRGWYWIPWMGYAVADGLSYPRGKAMEPLADEGPPVDLPLGASASRMPPEPHTSLYGSLSGEVTSGGQPVPDVWVGAEEEGTDNMAWAMTDAEGEYSFEGLVPGSYILLADPPSTPLAEPALAPEYYDNVPGIPSEKGSATLVDVYAAIETSGIDFDLSAGGSISGSVSAEGTQVTPLPGAIVTAYVEGNSWEPVAQTETNAQGDYVLDGLAAGTYYLEAVAIVPGYMSEYYDDVPAVEANQGQATGIAVAGGQGVTEIDFALGSGGLISGKVTGMVTPTPIQDATVVLYDGDWSVVSTTLTDSSGDFEFAGLLAGTYYLEALCPEGGYAGEYYDNVGALVMNRGSATALELGEGESIIGILIALLNGGVIEGTVIDSNTGGALESVAVTVYEDDFGAVAGQGTTDSSGHYAVGNLPGGSYRVLMNGTVITYTSEFFDNQPATEEGQAASRPVAVTAGATTSNINFDLEDRPTLSGTVTDDADPANVLEGVVVTAYDTAWGAVGSTTTAADGSYEIPLVPGEYYVAAGGLGYAREYYQEASDPGDAQLVTVGSSVSGIDFTLTVVGTIQVVSNVQSAPFTLTLGEVFIEGVAGATRVWSQSGLEIGTWMISWGAVPGFVPPPDESQVLHICDTLVFYGGYTLEGLFKVNDLGTTGTGAERELRIEWYGEVGKMYQVERTTDLLSDSWQNVGPPQAGIGDMMSADVEIGLFTAADSFFRVMAY